MNLKKTFMTFALVGAICLWAGQASAFVTLCIGYNGQYVHNSYTDTDCDGVSDYSDLCPETAPFDPVDAYGCSDAQVDADGDGVCAPGALSTGPSECAGTDWCDDIAPGDFVSLEDCLYGLVALNCSGVPRRDEAACQQAQLEECSAGCQEEAEPAPPRTR